MTNTENDDTNVQTGIVNLPINYALAPGIEDAVGNDEALIRELVIHAVLELAEIPCRFDVWFHYFEKRFGDQGDIHWFKMESAWNDKDQQIKLYIEKVDGPISITLQDEMQEVLDEYELVWNREDPPKPH